jgi:hypothetical protein
MNKSHIRIYAVSDGDSVIGNFATKADAFTHLKLSVHNGKPARDSGFRVWKLGHDGWELAKDQRPLCLQFKYKGQRIK